MTTQDSTPQHRTPRFGLKRGLLWLLLCTALEAALVVAALATKGYFTRVTGSCYLSEGEGYELCKRNLTEEQCLEEDGRFQPGGNCELDL